MARAEAAGRPIAVRAIVTAMRQFARSVEIAELSVRFRDEGVVGFDIAGPEAGFPPSRHLDAFQLIHRANFHVTIHAGEAFGLPSIWEALQWCGAERLGHGVRIVDDITIEPDGHIAMGRLAQYVRDRRVPLEMCPTSNVHTGAVATFADHPIDLLRRLRFRVTVNTDNRLMSGVSPERRVRVPQHDVRRGPGRDAVADAQRDEELLRPVRPAAAAHQRRHQAGLRPPDGRGAGQGADARLSPPVRRRAAAPPPASSTSSTVVRQAAHV